MTRLRTVVRGAAMVVLASIALSAVAANWIAPYPYAEQSRDHPSAAPSRQFPLGTDELGRDRFSRLVYGTRVSLLLAPAAALVSTMIALAFGGIAAFVGRWWESLATGATDMVLAAPTVLILFTVRALMPLNVSPWTSILITCGLLGALGWPPAARVIRADMAALLNADFLLQARAAGQRSVRILFRHLVPNFRPILAAQFWVLVPAFILAEANLSLLGLGVAEPLPSWGNMLRELENYALVQERPWILAPLAALMLTILCLYVVLPSGEEV
jgi:peptide/nickel transport system permease protein